MEPERLQPAVAAIAVTMTVQVVHSLAILAIPLMLPAAAAELGIQSRFAGPFTAMAYACCMVSGLLVASIIARTGALTLTVLASLIAAFGLAAFSGGSAGWTIAAALLLGMGYGVITPASAAILAGRVPQRMFGLVFSLKQTGVPIGFGLAGLAVPRLVEGIGWRSASLLLASILVVLAVVLLPFRRHLDQEAGSSTPSMSNPVRPFLTIVRSRQLRTLCLGSAAYLAAQACLGTFLVLYMIDILGLSMTEAGAYLALAQGAGIGARLVAGFLADRLAERFTLLAVLGGISTAGIVGTVAVAPAWSSMAISLACITYGIGALGWNGVMIAEVARWAPRGQVGAISAVSGAITYSGAVIGPAAYAVLVGLVSYRQAFLVVAGIVGSAAIALLRQATHSGRDSDDG